jgi:hypothetical protein
MADNKAAEKFRFSVGDIVHLNSGSRPGNIRAIMPNGEIVIDWSGNGIEASILPTACVHLSKG